MTHHGEGAPQDDREEYRDARPGLDAVRRMDDGVVGEIGEDRGRPQGGQMVFVAERGKHRANQALEDTPAIIT